MENIQANKESQKESEEDTPINLLLKKKLRCKPLQAALRWLVAQQVSYFYQVVAIKAFVKQQENCTEIWRVR